MKPRLLFLAIVCPLVGIACSRLDTVDSSPDFLYPEEIFFDKLHEISEKYDVVFEFKKGDGDLLTQRLLAEIESLIAKQANLTMRSPYDDLESFETLYYGGYTFGDSSIDLEFRFTSREVYSMFKLGGRVQALCDRDGGASCLYCECWNDMISLYSVSCEVEGGGSGDVWNFIFVCRLSVEVGASSGIVATHMFSLDIKDVRGDLSAWGEYID